MKGFINNIEDLAVRNSDFRQVLYTAKHCQLVLMALKPKEDIGAEVHKLDQFFRVEEGSGAAVLDGVTTAISAGSAVLVPAGTKHNIINTGSIPMKLYTLYAPPNHVMASFTALALMQKQKMSTLMARRRNRESKDRK